MPDNVEDLKGADGDPFHVAGVSYVNIVKTFLANTKRLRGALWSLLAISPLLVLVGVDLTKGSLCLEELLLVRRTVYLLGFS